LRVSAITGPSAGSALTTSAQGPSIRVAPSPSLSATSSISLTPRRWAASRMRRLGSAAFSAAKRVASGMAGSLRVGSGKSMASAFPLLSHHRSARRALGGVTSAASR